METTHTLGKELSVGDVLHFEALWDIPEYTATILSIGEFINHFDEFHEKWLMTASITMKWNDGTVTKWHITDEQIYRKVV